MILDSSKGLRTSTSTLIFYFASKAQQLSPYFELLMTLVPHSQSTCAHLELDIAPSREQGLFLPALVFASSNPLFASPAEPHTHYPLLCLFLNIRTCVAVEEEQNSRSTAEGPSSSLQPNGTHGPLHTFFCAFF